MDRRRARVRRRLRIHLRSRDHAVLCHSAGRHACRQRLALRHGALSDQGNLDRGCAFGAQQFHRGAAIRRSATRVIHARRRRACRDRRALFGDGAALRGCGRQRPSCARGRDPRHRLQDRDLCGRRILLRPRRCSSGRLSPGSEPARRPKLSAADHHRRGARRQFPARGRGQRGRDRDRRDLPCATATGHNRHGRADLSPIHHSGRHHPARHGASGRTLARGGSTCSAVVPREPAPR